MSYARFGWGGSNVYVFLTEREGQSCLTCCGCCLGDDPCFTSTQEMIDHLLDHTAAGDVVPEDIYQALRDDDDDNFGDAS